MLRRAGLPQRPTVAERDRLQHALTEARHECELAKMSLAQTRSVAEQRLEIIKLARSQQEEAEKRTAEAERRLGEATTETATVMRLNLLLVAMLERLLLGEK